MNQDIKLVIDQLNCVGLAYGNNQDAVNIKNAINMLETLGNKVAEQAAVIEKLIPAIRFDSLNMSTSEWRNICRIAEVAKTDSKQILKDWMRKQLGEPFGYYWNFKEMEEGIITGQHFVDGEAEEQGYTPLFKLPECLK